MKMIERYREDFEISPNVYRIFYNEDKDNFEIAFARKSNNEIYVHSNTTLDSEGFKVFFHSILDSMIDYCEKKNPKFLEECIKEYIQGKED